MEIELTELEKEMNMIEEIINNNQKHINELMMINMELLNELETLKKKYEQHPPKKLH